MQTDCENEPSNASNVKPGNQYMFDFEQYRWGQQYVKCEMAKNAIDKIEQERQNIEKDLKILEAINQEKSRQENIMMSLLRLKGELEEKLKSSENI